MQRWRLRALWSVTLTGGALGLLVAALVLPALAQSTTADPGSSTTLVLWANPKTGQVFIRPGRGRVRVHVPGATINAGDLHKAVEQQVQAQAGLELQKNQEQIHALQHSNSQLQAEMAKMRPAWHDYLHYFGNRFHVGLLLYGDYTLFTHTGFGPQFLTQQIWPGPGNEMYNSFDITRTYLNFMFTPTKAWTIRVTPNLYRTLGGTNQKLSSNSAVGGTLNGNLGVRIKYAYLQYKHLFANNPMFKGTTLTIGQQANPLVGWEEDLYGYRFVSLTPWNYLSLSSTQDGLAIAIPYKAREKTYLQYALGVYNNQSFHGYELTNTKEVMTKLTAYPFGAKGKFGGLGLTGFYNYGYGNTAPEDANAPKSSKGGNSHFTRIAAIVHYTAEQWGLAGEYDYGVNAFHSGNLFSGSGPADAFGYGPTSYAGFTQMTKAILDTGTAHQEGFDFFGHMRIPHTPFTVFGMFQQLLPNTEISKDPLDFQRVVVGVGYRYNKYLRFAVDSQNILYYHSQFVFPAMPGHGLASPVSNPVPRDTHALMLNVEFSY